MNDGDTLVDGIDANLDGTIDVDTGDRVLSRFPGSDYDDVEMSIADFSSVNQIVFDPIRGTSTTSVSGDSRNSGTRTCGAATCGVSGRGGGST